MSLPTRSSLYKEGFGKPSVNHSFTQEACADTCLHFVLKNGFLSPEDKQCLFEATNPLVEHLDSTRAALANYDFRWIRNIDTNWASQCNISKEKSKAMLACLYHYDLDVSLLMRYLGHNYTGAHRDVQKIVEKIKPHVDPYLIPHFIRVMTVGCPAHFNAESSRENSLKYWRAGNNPTINTHLEAVMKTMNKEERNNFVIPLPGWLWRFVPNLHFTPQHLLIKEGKKDRQISNARLRHDATSISLNMMAAIKDDTELDCQFGSALHDLLSRIWNLRITYPDRDIVLHANDVKSCFRQLKHHPDVMGAFSYILGDYLFLQCGQSFGSVFSPANWEIVRRVAEQLAEAYYEDDSLKEKHRKYLDKLQWQSSLGDLHARFTRAKQCSINQGVKGPDGVDSNTSHHFFVDDDLYAEVFNIERIETAIAAGIAAIFTLLGESDLQSRQDPISFDKMEEFIISYCNIVLGVIINTRKMTVETPPSYVRRTVINLQQHWHEQRKSFTLKDIETLAGELCHISNTAPWLSHLLSHIYTSITAALKQSESHLVSTNKDFRQMLNKLKQHTFSGKQGSSWSRATLEASYAASTTATMVHKSHQRFFINRTLRAELRLVESALSSPWINMSRPIAHFVKRDPSGIAWSDSSLDAAGGYSVDMKFWWYIHWPEDVRRHTLRFVKNNDANTLISINALEYAALIINYVASTHYFHNHEDPSDPYPSVLLYADNTTAESWLRKSCKNSFIGRALGRLQCALMINNPVGINVDHVTTKDNVVADRISRIKQDTDAIPDFQSLLQDFPQLNSCTRFHPSAELISFVMDALLRKNSVDPLQASKQILAELGKTTTSDSPGK